METINITKISNDLSGLDVMVCMPDGTGIILEPGQHVGFTSFSVPLIELAEEIIDDNIISFRVEGFPQQFAFSAIRNRGIVSALGEGPLDFFPLDPHLAHETLPDLDSDDSVELYFKISALSNGTLVTWVLGTLDEGDRTNVFQQQQVGIQG